MRLWAVELRREESRRRLEDLIRPAQLGVLPPQPPDLRRLLSRHAGPGARVHLGLADPLTQRLRGPDAQLVGDCADRRPVRGVIRPHLGDHPDRTLTQLRRVVARSTSHGSIFLSRSGASRNPGAVHIALLRDGFAGLDTAPTRKDPAPTRKTRAEQASAGSADGRAANLRS